MRIASVAGRAGRRTGSTRPWHGACRYNNHLPQARLQLAREPRPLPRLVLDPEVRRLEDFRYEDIRFEGYAPHPAIKAPVAV